MYHSSTGKVEDTPFEEESVRVPGPVCQGCIDQQREEDQEQDIRLEADPFCEGTGDKGRGDDRELKLEECEQYQWNGWRQ